MSLIVSFLLGALFGWRAPVFVESYRRVRPSFASRGRAMFVAFLFACGIGVSPQ